MHARGWRESLRTAAVLGFLLVTAYSGLVEGSSSWRSALTAAQRVASAAQLLYGIASAAALIAVLAGSRWALWLLLLWGLAFTTTGAMAPVVWGDAGVGAGAVAGIVVAALVALEIGLWRKGTASSARSALSSG